MTQNQILNTEKCLQQEVDEMLVCEVTSGTAEETI